MLKFLIKSHHCVCGGSRWQGEPDISHQAVVWAQSARGQGLQPRAIWARPWLARVTQGLAGTHIWTPLVPYMAWWSLSWR